MKAVRYKAPGGIGNLGVSEVSDPGMPGPNEVRVKITNGRRWSWITWARRSLDGEYRLHVKLADDHPFLHLLVQGGDGTYELYVNGKKTAGLELRSWLGVSRPTERVIWVGKGNADLELALRTHAPSSYTAWHLPLFLNFELGTPEAIGDAQTAAQSQRLYPALPSVAINLCVILAGFGSLALFLDQRMRKDPPPTPQRPAHKTEREFYLRDSMVVL